VLNANAPTEVFTPTEVFSTTPEYLVPYLEYYVYLVRKRMLWNWLRMCIKKLEPNNQSIASVRKMKLSYWIDWGCVYRSWSWTINRLLLWGKWNEAIELIEDVYTGVGAEQSTDCFRAGVVFNDVSLWQIGLRDRLWKGYRMATKEQNLLDLTVQNVADCPERPWTPQGVKDIDVRLFCMHRWKYKWNLDVV